MQQHPFLIEQQFNVSHYLPHKDFSTYCSIIAIKQESAA
jgi:hypothetical protein